MRKFYCQNCGAEVPLHEDKCPKCSSSFASVMCPKCYYTGSAIKFTNGCPKCGYLKNKEKESKVYINNKKSNFTLKLFIFLFTLLIISIILLIRLF